MAKFKEIKEKVIAIGEATGHVHCIPFDEEYEDVMVLEEEETKTKIIHSPKTGFKINHPEHKPLKIEEKGDYIVEVVKEYNHFDEEIRQIKD